MRGLENITADESRRVVYGHVWLLPASIVLMVAGLIAIPLLIRATGVLWPSLVVLVLILAFGVGSRSWLTHRLRVVRSQSPPS